MEMFSLLSPFPVITDRDICYPRLLESIRKEKADTLICNRKRWGSSTGPILDRVRSYYGCNPPPPRTLASTSGQIYAFWEIWGALGAFEGPLKKSATLASKGDNRNGRLFVLFLSPGRNSRDPKKVAVGRGLRAACFPSLQRACPVDKRVCNQMNPGVEATAGVTASLQP